MKKIIFYLLPLLLITFVLTETDSAQTRHRKPVRHTAKTVPATRTKTAYYISVGRSNAAQYSKKQWQQVADTFKRNGIPAFFAENESLPLSEQTRGEWLLVKIKRRLKGASADALLLGPFDSKTAARAAAEKFPALFSDEGSPLREDYDHEWSMGFYIILGVRTR